MSRTATPTNARSPYFWGGGRIVRAGRIAPSSGAQAWS